MAFVSFFKRIVYYSELLLCDIIDSRDTRAMLKFTFQPNERSIGRFFSADCDPCHAIIRMPAMDALVGIHSGESFVGISAKKKKNIFVQLNAANVLSMCLHWRADNVMTSSTHTHAGATHELFVN